MRVAVAGGTGVLGTLVVSELVARGDEVRVLSRSAPKQPREQVSHSRVDLTTGEGLATGLEGVEAVVDAVNDASRRAKDVLVEGGRRLLAAECDAGVGHHVAVSIVGCDRVPLGYYKTKVAQEQIVTEGTVPWSLLRATQFHDLIATIFGAAQRFRLAPTGPARFQPIDAAIVAKRLADAVHDGPAGRLPDVGGPEIETLTELSKTWRAHGRHRLLPFYLPPLGRSGRAMRNGGLCDPAAATPGPTFAEWLSGRGPREGS
jgi:uncharacterized protein YbjT (DUF2867 family)